MWPSSKKGNRVEIAKTIHRQLYAMDANLMMCMGARKFIGSDKSLSFSVSGLKFKGQVEIEYNYGQDLYTVRLVKNKKVQNEMFKSHGIKKFDTVKELVEQFDQVYFDELPSLLEKRVEGR